VLAQPLPIDPASGFPLVRILTEICRLNSELWYFDLTGFVPDDEAMLRSYRGTIADHYDWHVDIGRGKTASRKLLTTSQFRQALQSGGIGQSH